jgi:hypothetical protein
MTVRNRFQQTAAKERAARWLRQANKHPVEWNAPIIDFLFKHMAVPPPSLAA